MNAVLQLLPFWMLTKRAKQARIDALVAGFAAWVAGKPADGHYSYTSPTNCAFAQYLRSHGHSGLVGPGSFSLRVLGSDYLLPRHIARALAASRTFGELDAALSKAGA